jgi:hypothetical protein
VDLHPTSMTARTLSPAAPSLQRRHSALTSGLSAGAVVALLDGLYVIAAFVWILGVTTPQRLFQGIAYAVIGSPALDGGWRTALLGVLLHVIVASGWSIAWSLLYSVSATIRHTVETTHAALLTGVVYGVFVHLAMQLVVLPLTRARTAPLLSKGGLIVLLAHMLVIGPPIVLLVRRMRR